MKRKIQRRWLRDYPKQFGSLPQTIIPGKWTVRELPHPHGAGVDIHRKQLAVPMSTVEGSEWIRAHEKAHIRWSPIARKSSTIASDRAINAVEDCRINAALNSKRIASGEMHKLLKLLNVSEMNKLNAALIYVSGYHAFDSREGALVRAQLVNKFTGDERALITKIVEHADKLGRRAAESKADLSKKHEKDVIKLAEMLESAFAEREPVEIHTIDESSGGLYPPWGTMKIHQGKLSKHLSGFLRGRHKMPTDFGAALRYPHRALLDGMVFERKIPVPGVTLLIDNSGSMGLGQSEIEEIMKLAPASLIAAYCGSEQQGTLFIIAKDSKMADLNTMPRDFRYHGNIVDGPALAWLTKQPPPRIWLSDGGVTGIGDRGHPYLRVLARKICHAAQITQCREVEELRELVKGVIR